MSGAALLAAVLILGIVGGCQPFIREQIPPPPPPAVAPPPPPPARPTLYVAASRLNLRACAGMDCPKLTALERNDEVEPLSEAEDWTQVRVKRDGSIGWVASRYLSATPVRPEAVPAPLPPAPQAEGFQPVTPPVPSPPPPVPERPPVPEKPKPVRPAEPPAVKPAPKPAEAAEPARPQPPTEERPAPARKPPEERPAPPPEPPAEPPKKIRIM
ncbi:MAG: SH3 domain-containing protein [Syntrophobacterales bacterium]|nr:SH3 domain-containing protein [Syntrophobacterales bacterium]